ncbi:hypothetical protein HBH56_183420 [Parastagonospora nodorum]|uniref:Uncharacterized protein n=1 Tax=Phaeosphaeria nodorum (strain SN15 / ATCC MYA-4574 / FGSC 10173) TaxID=321614 RepID=A0A7U2FF77_PHANO|nr:hypothetical protein HBH56_183420 [Parastagonospora nodorum]QRD04139.1 hypothetical protein JI435_420770 [Parastagonospora nodorum SN15]KAH3926007.1 hypothetical protein HBH54_172570 [Parastagonospora nodorum]KAH3995386.1 hypothetical protein HBI10_173130 [Parastagonospora nodorum]KAH4016126.1 hypothetical protein HBI13_153620 [Parastagonospora nodorum]
MSQIAPRIKTPPPDPRYRYQQFVDSSPIYFHCPPSIFVHDVDISKIAQYKCLIKCVCCFKAKFRGLRWLDGMGGCNATPEMQHGICSPIVLAFKSG